jgi:hypothetical protein
MKKIVLMLSLVLLLVFSSVPAFAQSTNEIIVAIDSVKVDFNENTGLPLVDENYRTLVPFRKALETYGATVEWNNESRIATAVKGEIKVEVPIDQSYIIVNGEQKSNDTAAKIINGKTYLPIRAVIEAFGSDVQWDQNLNTVVITTVPIDAKATFTEANNKSYDWNNYDADVLLKMSMPVKDDAGSVTQMNMDMKMYMTLFMKPSLKAKVNASMVLNMMDQEVIQPIMDMYMTSDDTSLIQYMGMNDGTGKITWMKMTTENDMFANLLKYDAESIKANKELTEKYIKDVKYFGKYPDKSGKVLLKLQYTMSGEIYNDMFGKYMEEMTSSTNEQEAMTAEMIKGLANGEFGDLSFIIYVDETTKEVVKYEMDLSNIIASMMSGMTELLGDIPAEELEMLKEMKASMTMEVLNVNKAKDFEIPKEALDAQEMEEMVKQLEETATETTTETTTQDQ